MANTSNDMTLWIPLMTIADRRAVQEAPVGVPGLDRSKP